MEQPEYFKAGEQISQRKLNALVDGVRGGVGGGANFGNTTRRVSDSPQRMRGVLIADLAAPIALDAPPTVSRFHELVWLPERGRLAVVDTFPYECYNFEPDLTGAAGYYIKVEDMGDGIWEVYSCSCRAIYSGTP